MQERNDYATVRVMSLVLAGTCALSLAYGLTLSRTPLPAKGVVALGAVLIASFGVGFPWSRWLPGRLHHPGNALALPTHLVGWIAAGSVPFLVQQRQWIWLPLAVTTPLLILAIWMRKRWAYVPGLILAVGVALGGLAWLASATWRSASGKDVATGELVNSTRLVIGGLALALGLRLWRRGLDAPR